MNRNPLLAAGAARLSLALLLAGSASCAREQGGAAPKPVTLAYSSIDDSFASWIEYVPEGGASGSVEFGDETRPPALDLTARAAGKVGANKLVPARRGRVEFEYLAGPGIAENVFVFAIPMYNAERTRVRLLEFGANIVDDPHSGFSPARKRFTVPAAHRGDGQWHPATLEFDFTPLAGVIAVTIAPRVNEGATQPGPGNLRLRDVRIYSDSTRPAGGP